MTFYSDRVAAGTLVVGTTAPVPGSTTYAVDVENDGSIELASGGSTASGRLEVPVTISPANPLVIRADASLETTGNARMEITATFTEGTPFVSYGVGCPSSLPLFEGAVVTTPTTELCFFGVNGLVAANLAHFYLFGVSRVNVSLPVGALCNLLVAPVVRLPVSVGANGESSLVVPVPPGIGPGSFLAQYLVGHPFFGQANWVASVGLDVTFP